MKKKKKLYYADYKMDLRDFFKFIYSSYGLNPRANKYIGVACEMFKKIKKDGYISEKELYDLFEGYDPNNRIHRYHFERNFLWPLQNFGIIFREIKTEMPKKSKDPVREYIVYSFGDKSASIKLVEKSFSNIAKTYERYLKKNIKI